MQEDEGRLEEPDKSTPVSHTGRKRNDTIHMKILVPSGAVGAIIGKGGESIAHVQWETGARIKLSKPNDFYPGTMERVCLIQGTLDGVTRMHNYIMDRMLEKPECAGVQTHPGLPGSIASPVRPTAGGGVIPTTVGTSPSTGQTDFGASGAWSAVAGSRLPWGRHQQVKILVPNCTAGLVIGKVGSYVKEIKDRTGAFIQISQKSKEINLMERCITIAGEPDQCRAAVALVLAKIAEDPQSTSCPTISYSRVQGPVASAYPTGSPFALVSVPRVPGPISAQAGAPGTDLAQSATGYMPLPDPYMSPMVQAALMQAAALALNQRSYFQSAGQQSFMATSSPPQHAQTSQPGTISTHVGNVPVSQSGAESQTAATSAPTMDMSVYASLAQSGSAQLLPSGATGLWTESAWGPTAESHHAHGLSGLTGVTPSGTPTGTFEQAYPTPFNFAYFPGSQQLVTPIASRHPSESFPSGTDMYPQSPYGTNLPIAFGNNPPTLRVTSPAGSSPLGPIYPGLYSHLTAMGSSDVASPVSKLTALGATPSAVPLNELFHSMRLTGSNYPTSEMPQATELGQMFSTLSQHPAGFVNVSGYPVLSSPTGPPSMLTSMGAFIESSQQSTVQATPSGPPQLSLVSIESSSGTAFSTGVTGDPHSSHAPRPTQLGDITEPFTPLFGDQPVPVIAKRPPDPSEITSTTTSKPDDRRPSTYVASQKDATKQLPSSHSQSARLSSPPCSHVESPSSPSTATPTTKAEHLASQDSLRCPDPNVTATPLESTEPTKDASSSQSASSLDGSRPSVMAVVSEAATGTTVSSVETTVHTVTSKSSSGKRIMNGQPSGPKPNEVKK